MLCIPTLLSLIATAKNISFGITYGALCFRKVEKKKQVAYPTSYG